MYFNESELKQDEVERLNNLSESQKHIITDMMSIESFIILDELDSSASKNLATLFVQLAMLRDVRPTPLSIPENKFLPNWLYGKVFCKKYDSFILRNIGLTPFLNILGVDGLHLTQDLTLGINSKIKFQDEVSPLYIVLQSISDNDRNKLFHPFELGSKVTLDKVIEENTVTEKTPENFLSSMYNENGYEKKKLSTQIERDKELILEVTGECWSEFYKADRLAAIRLLVFFHQLRTSTSINLTKLIHNLDELHYFDLKPKAFNESKIISTKETMDWIDIRSESNPQVKAAALAEMLTYLYDGCEANFRDKIQGLELWFHHIVKTFSLSAVHAHRMGNSYEFEKLLEDAICLYADLGLPKKWGTGKCLFEKFSLGITKKIIKQYYRMHKNIEKEVLGSESLNFNIQPYKIMEIQATLQDPAFKSKLETKGITLKEAKENKLFRRVLFFSGLHHLMCAAGIIENINELSPKDMRVIFIISLSEYEVAQNDKTRIKFKKPGATSREGPKLVLDSLLKYAIKMGFQGKNNPSHRDLSQIYRAHALYWIEKFVMTRLQLESPALPHVFRYTRNKVASLLLKEF